jgi:hypothetical protein
MCKGNILAYDNQHLRVSSLDNFIPERVCRECSRDFKNTDQLVHETIISRKEKAGVSEGRHPTGAINPNLDPIAIW